MARILVVDNEPECRSLLTASLSAAGHTVDEAPDGKKAVSAACVYAYHLVILDIDLPKKGGMRALQSILDECPETTVIIKTEGGSMDSAVKAMKLGAYDVIPEPLHPDIVRLAVDRALAHRRLVDQNSHLLDELKRRYSFHTVPSDNDGAKKAYSMGQELAGTESPVLISGENGTGREYFARALHYQSSRASGPFVRVNCGAIPDEELEVVLFGREKGVSREHLARQIGRLEMANGGTLFIDEISELGPDIQEKLLRVLQHKEFERVGGSRTFRADVRIVASTSKDPSPLRKPEFAGDLYDFLNVFTVSLPPLRERQEDIPSFVRHFVSKYAAETGKRIGGISEQALQVIMACDWRGNIRQLENCVERSVMQCDTATIQPQHLSVPGVNGAGKRKASVLRPLRDIERDHIRKVLIQCNWNKSVAAGVLQIDRKTLRCKIREFGFSEPDGK